MTDELSKYFRRIGRKGGKAGTGEGKRKAGQAGAMSRWPKYREKVASGLSHVVIGLSPQAEVENKAK